MKNKILVIGSILKLIALISAVHGAPNTREDPHLVQLQLRNEAQRLLECNTSRTYSNLSSFEFNPRSVSPGDSACLSLRMFKEMGFIQQFNIPLEKLSRFIVRAQRGYRTVAYHNWDHGFSVLHFSFVILKNCKYIDHNCFRPLEGLALLTAAMCHDLDHPGTNSKFQEEINSPMAQDFKDQGSILERHHIEKMIDILEDPEANFVGQLAEDEHRQFMNFVKEIILATDLTRHFGVLPQEQQMASEGFNNTNERHHYLLRSIAISSADLSDLTKDWKTSKRVAKLIYTEFFDQGDREKEMGIVPAKMMDRKQANIAEEQVNFISNVVMPLFRVLLATCSEAKVPVDSIEQNLKYWNEVTPYFNEQLKKGREQLQILDDEELDRIPTLVKE